MFDSVHCIDSLNSWKGERWEGNIFCVLMKLMKPCLNLEPSDINAKLLKKKNNFFVFLNAYYTFNKNDHNWYWLSEIISLWINKNSYLFISLGCTAIGRENELGNLSICYALNSEGDLWILYLPDSWMVTLIVGLVERGYICCYFCCLLSVFLQMKIYFLVRYG